MRGLARRFGETTQPKIERAFFIALGGIVLGYFVLLVFQLPLKFTYYFVAGPVILFVALLTGHFKRFFQGLLIFIIPVNYSTHFFRRPYLFGTTGLAFSPLDIVLILLYIIWLYELFVKRSATFHFFPRITVPAFVLVGISGLTMVVARDPYLSLFETVLLVKVVLLYLYVANHIRSRKDINFILVLLLVGMFLQSILAFAQRWLGVSLGLHLFGEYKEVTVFTLDYYLATARVGGTIGHPNNLAKYVELLVPLSMALWFTNMKMRYKLASGVAFVCAFIVILLTLSRGGWVCFAGSIVLFFILIFRARLISLQTLVTIAVLVFIFASVGLAFSGLVQSRLFGDDYGAAYSRIPLNKIALSVVKAHPLLGVGVKNYWMVMHQYNPNLQDIIVNVVHNAYLLKAAEMGIPGLLIFLWLLAAIFLQGLRNLKTTDIFFAPISIGLVSGMAALWAHWLVDPGYLGRVVVLWVLVGLLTALGRMQRENILMTAPGG